MKLISIFFRFSVLLLPFALAACSGGSTGSAPSPVTGSAVLEGVAAAGAPLTGTVTVSDSSYPTRKVSAPINQDGTFSVAVDTLTPPLLIRAAGTVSGTATTLFSFTTSVGTVQVNPLTNLLVTAASGSQGMTGMFDLYSTHNRSSLQTIANNLPGLTADLKSTLKPLLALYSADSTDPFTAIYQVNHQGLDGLFDDVSISMTSSTATITNRSTGAAIYTASLANIATGALDTTTLPTPVSYAKPGNARLTLQLNGLPTGTLVKRLKTTIKLPLGVTVDQGVNAVNTAITSGVASDAVVYPLPALSATNNELSIELSSLKGFSNGEFLTLRTIVSYNTLNLVQSGDYKVLLTQLYSDIYKSAKISGGTITTAALVFPTVEGEKMYKGSCAGCHTIDANDTVGRPTLRNKGSLLTDKFAKGHRGINLTTMQIEDLQAYLAAVQ